ncbi:hypothetical protein JXA47_06810 [Candidatus Sumerlaeota bacterium]|nr:hypothetical protein [Candidatus Sumerlaeota bacterium]
MLSEHDWEISLRHLDEMLTEVESEPWPLEEHPEELLRRRELIEAAPGADDSEME